MHLPEEDSHIDSDCVMHNLLMDADAMYPEGFHPIKIMHKPDYSGWATYVPRSIAGVRYYFAEFGISVHIPEEDRPGSVTGNLGRDQDPPELSATIPYDPFKLDIFIIGNMLEQELYKAIIPLPLSFAKADGLSEIRQRWIYSASCRVDDQQRS